MSARLLLIEARRSPGLWALLALPIWLWLNRDLARAAPFWFETSLIARNAAGVIGPILGGMSAWIAGRESRRGLGDLLATTPHPHLARRLTTWGGAVAWGVLGYLVIGVLALGAGWSRATWGGPFLGPILVGLVALPVYAALGFAIGRRSPGRFAAPLVAIALLVLPITVGEARNRWAFLSPLVSLGKSIWVGLQPDLTGLQLAFLLCLGAAALLSLALPARKRWRTALGCAALVALVAAPALAIGAVAPRRGGQELSTDPRYRALRFIPYTPVCAMAAPLPVCVHPAYHSSLDETTASLNRLVAPILGLPGAPTRAEQGYAAVQGRDVPAVATTLWFDLNAPRNVALTASTYSLVRDPAISLAGIATACPGNDPNSCLQAQAVIGRWLLRQAGVNDARTMSSPQEEGRVALAVDRFAALDPAAQRAWLEAHFADLRAGRLTLEDLP